MNAHSDAFAGIPVCTDAARRYEERNTALLRWSKKPLISTGNHVDGDATKHSSDASDHGAMRPSQPSGASQ